MVLRLTIVQVSKTLKEKYSLENKQKLWQKCWEISPEMHILLKESSTVDEAREKIIHYITSIDWSYRRDLADNYLHGITLHLKKLFVVLPISFLPEMND
jgi:hypothetical protein